MNTRISNGSGSGIPWWRWGGLAGLLLLAGYFAWPDSLSARISPPQRQTVKAATSPRSPVKALKFRRIEQIRVGQRVLGANPELTGAEPREPDPEPATWRQLTLRMQKTSGKQLDIVLLRPLDWINQLGAEVGATIELDLIELGAAGAAEVLSIEPCPAIEAGPGNVVTGTFAHEPDGKLVNVSVEGVDRPIGCTDNHPFWSEDRQEFVDAGKLLVGERVLTRASQGMSRVLALEHRPDLERVFNLEVYGQHTYEVSDFGVLVHNGCVHPNSSLSTLANHGYAIINRRTGEIYKFGISSRHITDAGLSQRAQDQLTKLAKRYGVDRKDLETVVLRKFENRLDAQKWEKETVGFFRNNLGHLLPANLRPKGIAF